MAESVLTIDNVDYSCYIKFRGMGWKREDIDSEKAGRTKDGVMHRGKIGNKRKLSFTLANVPQSILAGLDDALNAETVEVTYLDLHQTAMTKTFYCSSFDCTLQDAWHQNGKWCDAKFNLIEV